MFLKRVAKAVGLVIGLCYAATAQLNQYCTVSVLNRNVQVNPDGTWVLPNVPANFGQVKARATCVRNGVTTSGESAFFTVTANTAVNLPAIVLGNASQIPSSLTIAPSTVSFTGVGQTTQLTVTAMYPDNSTKNVTAASTGTNYTTSNPAIATISADGLVTSVASGTVVIQAINDGAAAILTAKVTLPSADSDGDGIPDNVEIQLGMNPNDPTDAQQDFDRDSLTNLQEYWLGTDIRNPDTDGDGLSDGDEVNKYHTSPLIPDTDGDGIPDGIEVQTGSNPLDRNSYDLSKAVSQLTVSPTSFLLTVNSVSPSASQQLTVTGRLIDGKTTIDLTSTARRTNYSSSNLSVCTFGAPDGRVFAGTDGTCTITVTNGGFTAAATATVSTFNPTEVSTLSIDGAVAVDVAGDFAYVAAGTNGLVVVDVTDRVHPTIRGNLTGIGDAQAVRIAGSYAYVGDVNGFLRVVQVTNPAAPALVTSLQIAGRPNALAVHGSLAAVAAQSGGVSLVDISDPTAPGLIAGFTTPAAALGVDFDPQRNLAAVAMGTGGVQVVDISTPAAPKLRGRLTGGDVRRVLVRYPGVLLADVSRSVTGMDISNPDVPVLGSSTPANLGGAPVDIAAFNNIAITADVSFGRAIPIINVANPVQPVALGFWTPTSPGFGSSIAMDIRYGYYIMPGLLRIGQYQKISDPFGIPPTVQITSPTTGPLIQGATITLSANASDDVAVASVTFFVNGQPVFTAQNPPYQTTYFVPSVATSLTFGASAADYANNIGTGANITIPVIPDPLTTARGRVLNSVNLPVAGATVSDSGKSATTAADGTFTLAGLPTLQGSTVLLATAVVSGVTLGGLSTPTPPVLGGITNVGDISIFPKPLISGLKLKGVLAGSTVQNFTVTGANLTNATFSLLPITSPPPMTITLMSASPSGDSASLMLRVESSASGKFSFLASNPAGTSDPNPSFANTITILIDPNADADLDGMSNGQEAQIGTDPLSPDTDADGFTDGVEVASGSDPLNSACIPLNCRISGNVISEPFSASVAGPAPDSPSEVNTVPFTVLNAGATASAPIEANSVPFSVLSATPTSKVPVEVDTIPFSICNGPSQSNACPNYSGLSLVSALKTAGSSRKTARTENTLGRGEESVTTGGRPLSVLAVAPTDQATNVSTNSSVAFVFSAPLDPSSITPANFSISAGDRALPPNIRYSSDFRTVMLSVPLPIAALVQVSVSGEVRDIWGRSLPSFQSQFHTVAASGGNAGLVVAQRPPNGASGISPDSTIYLALSRAVDWALVDASLRVTEDGETVDGRIQLAQGGRIAEFVPSSPFHSGSVVKVSISGTPDTGGHVGASYEGLFTTAAPESTALEPVRVVPGRATAMPANSVLEIEYSRPLDSSSVTESTVSLREASTSTIVASHVVLRGDRVVRIIPLTPLSQGGAYAIEASTGVQDVGGQRGSVFRRSFIVSKESLFGLPRLLAVTPAEGTRGLDIGSEIHLSFDRPLNALTLNAETVHLTQSDASVAFSLSLAKDGTEIIVTPTAFFKTSSRVTLAISGAEDLAGNQLPSFSVRFQVHAVPGLARTRSDSNDQLARRRATSDGRRLMQFLTRRRR